MELLRIPKYSYLASCKYRIEEGFLDNRVFSLENSSAEQNHFTWSSGDIYLPEYLPMDEPLTEWYCALKGHQEESPVYILCRLVMR